VPFSLKILYKNQEKSLAYDQEVCMMFLKKLVKCFIPYGFLVLRRKYKEKEPLYIKYMKIEKETKTNYLCDINIKKTDESSILQICREDYKYPIFLRNDTFDIDIYRAILEDYEYDFAVKNKPKYIIDAGANIGMASIYFATKYENAIIIAIEPEEENYKMLKRNTENYKNIFTINAALWNISGEVSLFAADFTSTLGYMTETNKSALKSSYKQIQLTRAITVEEIINQFNINSIDVLKMDIEGSEKEVFESCGNWIDKTNSIIIELHERMKKGCNKSFYRNTKSFHKIGRQGEDIYLSKDNYIKMIW
jgi:FkbM family methyltransferase